MARLNPSLWKGRKVLLTGHTGFKGTWMTELLNMLGAQVAGFALAPDTHPSHFEVLHSVVDHTVGDIRKMHELSSCFQRVEPEVVIHMAAQPLVLKSYEDPRETYETNVMGTLNVLECARFTPSVRSVVVVTSDKCYENDESKKAYTEDDPMGGYDPYSSSKGCAELLTSSYRRSFFNVEKYGGDHHVLLASVRAGNVLGGGDWTADRLVPDFARAYADGRKVVLRNMSAVRPWQHVLEPLYGYLVLAERLIEGDVRAARGWNFGPTDTSSCWSVERIVAQACKIWRGFEYEVTDPTRHEAKFLMLDSSLARRDLGWKPLLNVEQTMEWTLKWYEAFIKSGELLTKKQIADYLERQT